MKTKIIDSVNPEKLIGVLSVDNKRRGFINYITPFRVMNGEFLLGNFHLEVNSIVKDAKEYCDKNNLKLIQYGYDKISH